jgi:hypothetical protein
MSEMRFTPGPWEISQEPPRWIIQSSGVPIGKKPICFMVGDYVKCAGDAFLIAASPDLYAALQMLHDDIAEYAKINNLGGFDNHDMRQARAALAKARGEK